MIRSIMDDEKSIRLTCAIGTLTMRLSYLNITPTGASIAPGSQERLVFLFSQPGHRIDTPFPSFMIAVIWKSDDTSFPFGFDEQDIGEKACRYLG